MMGFKIMVSLASICTLVIGHSNHGTGYGSWQSGAGSFDDTSSIVAARLSPSNFDASGSSYWDSGKANQAAARSQNYDNSHGAQQYGRQGRHQNLIPRGSDSSPFSGSGLGRSWSIYNMNWGDTGRSSYSGSSGLSSNRGYSSGNSRGWSGNPTSGSSDSGWNNSGQRSSYDANRGTEGGWGAANARSRNTWDSGNALSRNSNTMRSSWPDKAGTRSNNQWQTSSW